MHPFKAGLWQRCPACGKAGVYEGLLSFHERCPACGLALGKSDVGDGAPYFVILVMTTVTMLLGAWLEFAFAPPLWLHILLWLPFVMGGSIYLLRLIKAVLVAYQYRYRPKEFEDS